MRTGRNIFGITLCLALAMLPLACNSSVQTGTSSAEENRIYTASGGESKSSEYAYDFELGPLKFGRSRKVASSQPVHIQAQTRRNSTTQNTKVSTPDPVKTDGRGGVSITISSVVERYKAVKWYALAGMVMGIFSLGAGFRFGLTGLKIAGGLCFGLGFAAVFLTPIWFVAILCLIGGCAVFIERKTIARKLAGGAL